MKKILCASLIALVCAAPANAIYRYVEGTRATYSDGGDFWWRLNQMFNTPAFLSLRYFTDILPAGTPPQHCVMYNAGGAVGWLC